LRRPSRTRLQRRAEANRFALLYRRFGAQLPPSLKSADDAQFPALARRRIADHAEFLLQTFEFLRLGRILLFGVAPFERGLVLGLLAEIADGDPVPEYIVAAQTQLRVGIFRQAVAQGDEFIDQIIEGRMVPDVDELFDSSRHS